MLHKIQPIDLTGEVTFTSGVVLTAGSVVTGLALANRDGICMYVTRVLSHSETETRCEVRQLHGWRLRMWRIRWWLDARVEGVWKFLHPARMRSTD